MNIGQVAKNSGISAKMIRYYEDIGVLPASKRSDAGYRMYSEDDLKTLHFIRHARELGFSTEQMKELLELWKNHDRQSAEVKDLTQKHILALKQKIVDLQTMVDHLEQSVRCCAGNQQSECEILNKIEFGMN